jgi:hypothetical protein
VSATAPVTVRLAVAGAVLELEVGADDVVGAVVADDVELVVEEPALEELAGPVGVVICGGVGAAVVPAAWVCAVLVGPADDTAGEPAWGVEMNAVSPPAAFDDVEVW